MSRRDHGSAVRPESDDTGFSAVATCTCGRSFLGLGPDRVKDARRQLAWHLDRNVQPRSHGLKPKHTPAASLSELVAGISPNLPLLVFTKPRTAPLPAPEPREPKKRGGPGNRYLTPDSMILEALADGMKVATIAKTLRVSTQRIKRVREGNA